MQMFFNSPIWGNGLTIVDEEFISLASSKYGFYMADNTNTLFIQLARFGIFYFAIFVLAYWKTINCYFKVSVICKLFILTSIFILFFGENLSYSFLFSLFLFFDPAKIKNAVSIDWEFVARGIYINE